MAFFVYSLIYVLLFFLAQLPSDYRIEVNVEAICASITFVDEEGVRIPVPDWVLGPGKRRHKSLDDQTSVRLAAAQNWARHQDHYGSVIPVVRVHGALNKESGITAPSDLFTKNTSAAMKCMPLIYYKCASIDYVLFKQVPCLRPAMIRNLDMASIFEFQVYIASVN